MTVFKPITSRIADIDVVPATADLLERFYGHPQRLTVRAMVFLKKGQPIGVAGIKTEQGVQVLFSETKPDVTLPPMTKWRCAKMVVEAAKACGKPVYAYVSLGDFRSQKWIRKLGFKLAAANANGEVYRWA